MDKSPFPGMDPYLEDSAEWGSVHTRLITAIGDQLAPLVAPHFIVRFEQRVYLLDPDEDRAMIEPDVYLVQGYQPSAQPTALAVATPPVLVEPLLESEVRDRYIEIRDKRNREVITTVEILSPFSKTPGVKGYTAFLKKRNSVMASDVHWVEIDLLRAGERPREVAHKSDYYALLKRGGTLGPYEVWYCDVRDRLPTIFVPLRPPFADVLLDLQAAFDEVYQHGYYADDIDYTSPPPPPPLRPADGNWVRERIAAWQAQRTASSPA
jgi:hypothetical protein